MARCIKRREESGRDQYMSIDDAIGGLVAHEDVDE